MPQINRIRVNNVKYNFGTQFYDDFLMRWSCRNTIYDLANGGGKSVLMLLLLQNLIPNCTLDDKQPVEKLFRSNNASTTIHSLIEWKLDSCDVKDGFRYMTTGFCARKGHDTPQAETTSTEQANIEYFNYCIFYREFGENDIKNLPLSNEKERITYTGLRNYLKDLEKKDFGVQVKIFDRKGDYQHFISNYGLYESQWEIIRGINKTEGHVRTYFENNYKTTRKVIEDLLIEEIIEKSYNNRIRKDSDNEEMAQTLLDIKDKLLELSKRKNEIDGYDTQINLLKEFSDRASSFQTLYDRKEKNRQNLMDYLISCRAKLAEKQQKADEFDSRLEELKKELSEENRLVEAAEIEQEYKELENLKVLIDESQSKREKLTSQKEAANTQLVLRETAADYEDYQRYKKLYDEMKEIINNRHSDQGDLMEEIKVLAAHKYDFYQERSNKGHTELEEINKRLEEVYQVLEAATEEERTAYGENVSLRTAYESMTADTARLEEELASILSNTGLLVADKAQSEVDAMKLNAEKTQTRVDELRKQIENETERRTNASQDISNTKTRLELLNDRINDLSSRLQLFKQDKDRADQIAGVYGVTVNDLADNISVVYDSACKELYDAIEVVTYLEDYKTAIENGKLPGYGRHYKAVLDYLAKRYPKDIVTGTEYLESVGADEQQVLFDRIPFINYAVIVKDEFDRISKDAVLSQINTGSYIVPIINETLIMEEHDMHFQEDVFFAYKNMSFVYNESELRSELSKASEELNQAIHKQDKYKDRCQVIKEDLDFITYYESRVRTEYEKARNEHSKLKDQYRDLEASRSRLLNDIDEADTKINIFKRKLDEESRTLTGLLKDIPEYSKAAMANERLATRYEELKNTKQALSKAASRMNDAAKKLELRQQDREALENRRNALTVLIEDMDSSWKKEYEVYYVPGMEYTCTLTEEETDAKAAAIRKILTQDMSDISDKEQLMSEYRNSMKKMESQILYRGYTLEDAVSKYESGELVTVPVEELMKNKNTISVIGRDIDEIDRTLDAQNAQYNRIEGSISHATGNYEQKYGEYEKPQVNNPAVFIASHRQEISAVTMKINECMSSQKAFSQEYKDVLLMEKDLQRIIQNAGLEVPQTSEISVPVIEELSVEAYEAVQKDFSAVLKEENRAKDDFAKQRQNLINELNRLNAFELAQEIEHSVKVPDNSEDAKALANGIKETNECIALERDRVGKGIEDMEKIKDSFENRCLQICSNIKTELERLPKMSRITMDNDVISIITLSVPYIKEEMYKNRMSVYINETVAGAETFTNPDEKLKYLKNRLSWKRLFSVIVTDMNSIKLCLYKREHIKDQSRYLRYEEAVGSTGQSQGIYIQFLIAIINYISSINASGKDVASLGKTIFIDNPFGAAKDIYIWEPIFGLLKTNHVQLIVPARGATPAITGRFDVNYVLGQKMMDGRQQTVVVDYRSQIQGEEMEYDRLQFEQTSLNLS